MRHATDDQSQRASASTGSREEPRRALGRTGERLAATHLERLGFAVIARNVLTRTGELDLIAFDGSALVFVEVKTRRVRRGGAPIRPEQDPLPWLRPQQRARLRRQAVAWLTDAGRARPRAETIRFDAIGVIVDGHDHLVRLEHVEAAW
jgi:putative endonuclease